jgi:hypothetical protein
VGDTIHLQYKARLVDGQEPAKVLGPHLYSGPFHPHHFVFIGGVIKPQQPARVFVYLCRGLTPASAASGHIIASAASVRTPLVSSKHR